MRHLGTTGPLVAELGRRLPDARIQSFDCPAVGPPDAEVQISIKDPAAIFQLIRAPRGLGLARAWVTGQIEITGDVSKLVKHENVIGGPKLAVAVIQSACRILSHIGTKPIRSAGPTNAEYRKLRPGAHTISSDMQEIDFHYSLPDMYYSLILGSSMTYSCGIYPQASSPLQEAQANKHAIIARKLEISDSSNVLDIGCGWGGFIAHLDENFRCTSTGITASSGQYTYIKRRYGSHEAGRHRVLHGDYRKLLPISGITCIASVGMYEHVGINQSSEYFDRIRHTLPPGGLLLNQAIVRTRGDARFKSNGFIQRYIFPNAHVLSLSRQLQDIERAGLSVISIETFGEHYARTLSDWRSNLQSNWEKCIGLVGEQTVRAWLMYLEGSKDRFENRVVDLAQVLVRRP